MNPPPPLQPPLPFSPANRGGCTVFICQSLMSFWQRAPRLLDAQIVCRSKTTFPSLRRIRSGKRHAPLARTICLVHGAARPVVSSQTRSDEMKTKCVAEQAAARQTAARSSPKPNRCSEVLEPPARNSLEESGNMWTHVPEWNVT